jgi:hypothetical protein
VRGWLARNETVSCDLLRELAHDVAETLRGYVAINYYAPQDAMSELAAEPSPTVRKLVAWKTSLRETASA